MLTTEEKTAVQAEIAGNPSLQGAAAHIVASRLNEIGSAQVEQWVVSDQKKETPRIEILAKMSMESQAKFFDLMEAGADSFAKSLKLQWTSMSTPDVTRAEFRALVDALLSMGIITQTERDTLMQMGEEKASRSYELIGRKITADEVQEAVNG